MIVEVFKKGSCFREHIETVWQIKSILQDGGKFILITDEAQNVIFDAELCELRVTY